MGNVVVTVRTVTATPASIDNVLVQVFDSSMNYLTEGLTGTVTPGEVAFTLNGEVAGEEYFLLLQKDEWSFPPANQKSINVFDPPSPPNEFEFEGERGTDTVTVVIAVEEESTGDPIDDVLVQVYEEDETFLTSGLTGISYPGEYVLHLESAPDPGVSYIVRLSKPGVSFPAGNAQVILVVDEPIGEFGTGGFGEGGFSMGSEDPVNTFDFIGRIRSLAESTDPDLCLISGRLLDVGIEPLPNLTLRFIPRYEFPEFTSGGSHVPGTPAVLRDNILAADRRVKTDRTGYAEISLPRGGMYDVHIYGLEYPPGLVTTIVVPDQAGANLADILFPYIQSVVYTPGTLSVGVGSSEEVTVEVLNSNGQEIVSQSCLMQLLEFTSSDEDVATVEISDDGTITVTGVAAGTATIGVSRVDGTWSTRRPEISDIEVTDLGVTVI